MLETKCLFSLAKPFGGDEMWSMLFVHSVGKGLFYGLFPRINFFNESSFNFVIFPALYFNFATTFEFSGQTSNPQNTGC